MGKPNSGMNHHESPSNPYLLEYLLNISADPGNSRGSASNEICCSDNAQQSFSHVQKATLNIDGWPGGEKLAAGCYFNVARLEFPWPGIVKPPGGCCLSVERPGFGGCLLGSTTALFCVDRQLLLRRPESDVRQWQLGLARRCENARWVLFNQSIIRPASSRSVASNNLEL